MTKASAARGTAKEALTNASSWCSQPASTSRRADCRFRCEQCRMPASISERCQRDEQRRMYTRAHKDMHRQRNSSKRCTIGLSRPHMRCYSGRVRQTRSPWHISFEHCPRASSLARTIRERTRSVMSAWIQYGHYKLCDTPAHTPPWHISLLAHLGKLHLHPRNASISGPQAAACEMRASCQDA